MSLSTALNITQKSRVKTQDCEFRYNIYNTENILQKSLQFLAGGFPCLALAEMLQKGVNSNFYTKKGPDKNPAR
jgi:hypothetical protein